MAFFIAVPMVKDVIFILRAKIFFRYYFFTEDDYLAMILIFLAENTGVSVFDGA